MPTIFFSELRTCVQWVMGIHMKQSGFHIFHGMYQVFLFSSMEHDFRGGWGLILDLDSQTTDLNGWKLCFPPIFHAMIRNYPIDNQLKPVSSKWPCDDSNGGHLIHQKVIWNLQKGSLGRNWNWLFRIYMWDMFDSSQSHRIHVWYNIYFYIYHEIWLDAHIYIYHTWMVWDCKFAISR